MSDVHSKEIRSYNMSRIRGKDTKPEEIVRKYLFSQGFRYRKNDSRLPGKPDVVLPKYHTVIFVQGCFWHRHQGCKGATTPKTRTDYWNKKFERNIENDKVSCRALKAAGWNVITLWEYEINKRFDETMDRLVLELKGNV